MLEWISFSYSQTVNLPKNKSKGFFSTPFISVVTLGLTRPRAEKKQLSNHTYLGEEREEGSGKKTETEDFQFKSQTE